jgi:hypothetical protein
LRPPRLARLVAISVAVALVAPAPAGARPDPTSAELAEARERFAQARKLEDAGKWAEALELLKKVSEVRITPQVRFHIALCHENLGLWTQALDGFTLAAREAVGTAPDVIKESNQHVAALEKRIPTLTVRVNGAAQGDELLLDKRPIPLGDPPLPVRVDPGPHVVEVRRGEAIISRLEFSIDPGSTRRLDAEVAPAPPTPPPTATVAPTATAPQPPPDTRGYDGSTQRTIGWIALGVGAASAIAAGVFTGLRAAAVSDVEEECQVDLGQCKGEFDVVDPIRERGETYSLLVNVFAVGAGVSLVTGAVLLFTAPAAAAPPAVSGKRQSPPAPQPSVRALAWVVPGSAGVSVGGRF